MSTTTIDRPALSPTDRCDSCGAQAYVRVVLTSGDLLFCGHHFNRHAGRLKELAVRVEDYTQQLERSNS